MVKHFLRPIAFPIGMINLGFIKRVIQKVVGVLQAFGEQWRGLGMLALVDLGTQGLLAASSYLLVLPKHVIYYRLINVHISFIFKMIW